MSQPRSSGYRSGDSEVEQFRAALEQLTLRVNQQEQQIEALGAAFERIGVVGATETDEDFAVIAADLPVDLGGPPSDSISWTERERIARDIGLWLRKCLNGQQRGPSGRDKLRGLASRYYIFGLP